MQVEREVTPDPGAALAPPCSASSFGVSVLALIAGLALLAVLQEWQPQYSIGNVLGSCALIAGIIACHDLMRRRIDRAPSAGRADFSAARVSPARIGFKLLGLTGTLGAVAAAYLLFPEYHGSFYTPFWLVLRDVGPWLLLAALPYFWWMDGAQTEPRDGYWHLGRVLLGRESPDWSRLAQHGRGWVVKGFFLPLMVVFATLQVNDATRAFHSMVAGGGLAIYDFFYNLGFLIAVPFVPRGHWLDALRACVLISGVNFIYFMRAKTEEWHLSRDPDYRTYCERIAQHGLWAKLRRVCGQRNS